MHPLHNIEEIERPIIFILVYIHTHTNVPTCIHSNSVFFCNDLPSLQQGYDCGDDGRLTQLDHIVVSPYAVFVIGHLFFILYSFKGKSV